MPKAASFATPLPPLSIRSRRKSWWTWIRYSRCIWGGEDNGGKYLARKKAGERWKRQLKRKSCNLNSSGLVRLMSRLCGHFASACNKTRLNPIARSNTASIFIYACIHTNTYIFIYVCNFVTMITHCFKSLFNCKATPSITQSISRQTLKF